MTKYVVFVNEFNQNANESVSFEETFNSLKDVTKYVSCFSCNKYCSGHVDKLALVDGEWFSDTIMHF